VSGMGARYFGRPMLAHRQPAFSGLAKWPRIY
jgi:hypothetical protein